MAIGGESDRGRRFLAEAFRSLIRGEHFQLVAVLAGVGFTASQMVNPDATFSWLFGFSQKWSIFAASCLAAVYGTVVGFFLRKYQEFKSIPLAARLAAAEDRVEDLEFELGEQQALFKGVIEQLITAVSETTSTYGPDYRTSLYIHNGTSFMMIARVSDNPAWEKPGRSIYPDNQGAIAKAWAQKDWERTNLRKDRKAWEKQLVDQFGFDAAVTSKLNMQSRSIAGMRLSNLNGKLAVMIVESTSASAWPKNLPGLVRKSRTWDTLSAVLSASTELMPDMMNAKSKGF